MSKAYAAVAAAVIGLFYLVAPHSLHESTGLGLHSSHFSHMAFGASLLVFAATLYITARKPGLKGLKPGKFRYDYKPR